MIDDHKEIKRIALYLASKAKEYTFIDPDNRIWGLSGTNNINKFFPNLEDMDRFGPHIAHFIFKEEMEPRFKKLCYRTLCFKPLIDVSWTLILE